MSCPICGKRKPNRFCPAKGEKICAVCCGTEREVSIDCPVDCPYLIAAHRYEDEHQREIAADTALLDVQVPRDLLHTHQQLMSVIAFSAAKFCASHPDATDPEVLSSLQALAETYKILSSGIVYEKQPAGLLAGELYTAIASLLNEIKQKQTERANSAALKDSDIFYTLVFLYRMGLLRTNGRPRARRYIEFLRAQFPQAQELKREESRIIVP